MSGKRERAGKGEEELEREGESFRGGNRARQMPYETFATFRPDICGESAAVATRTAPKALPSFRSAQSRSEGSEKARRPARDQSADAWYALKPSTCSS